MKYQIIGKNIEVTDGIRSAVEKKLSRMDKYFIINDTTIIVYNLQHYVKKLTKYTIFKSKMPEFV